MGITDLVNEMANHAGAISGTVGECKKGISETAENIGVLVGEMGNINQETDRIFAEEKNLRNRIQKYKVSVSPSDAHFARQPEAGL